MGEAALAATSAETAQHSDDVELITGAMCDYLELPDGEREAVLAAARLHDIGKMAMPPGILEKTEDLNAEEWRLIRQHTVVGEQILASVNELTEVARLVRHSHERWDGDGYPDGLEGERIPLGSRIIFCADAFHAIRSDRPYRNGTSAERALAEVRRNAGSQFDPRVVAALTEVVRELRIAPAGAPSPSPRLAALLLALVLGLAGSAFARSDLLDDASGADSAPRPGFLSPVACESTGCLLGPVLFEPTSPYELASNRAPAAGDRKLGTPGFKPGRQGAQQSPGKKGKGDDGSAREIEDSPGNSGSASSGTGNAGGNGNGVGAGSGNRTGPPGRSGSAPGHGGGGNSKSSGKSGGSGKSGKTGGSGSSDSSASPGNSGNAPGQQRSPGNSGNALGHSK